MDSSLPVPLSWAETRRIPLASSSKETSIWGTPRGAGDAGKLEFAEQVVVLGHGALTLEDLDQDDGLVVGGRGEDLGLASGDGGVAGNQLGHDSSGGLDSKGKRVHVHEDDVLGTLLAAEDTGLDSRTERDGLVRVDALGGRLAEVLLNHGLNLGDTSGATDEDDVVNLALGDLRVLQNLLNRLQGLLEEIHVQLLELGAGESLGEVLSVEEVLNLDTGGLLGGEGSLGLLGLALELAHGLEVLGDVDIILLVEGLGEVVDDTEVKVLTTKAGITGGSQDLKDTLLDGQERDIEGTTTEIVDDDLALAVGLVKTIGDSGGGGLVDDTQDGQAGNLAGVLGSLALVVVEVGRDGNDGVSDLLSKVALRDLLHPKFLVSCQRHDGKTRMSAQEQDLLSENHGADLLGREGLVRTLVLDREGGFAILGGDLVREVLDVGLDILLRELATNEALHVEDGVLRVGRGLVLRRVSDKLQEEVSVEAQPIGRCERRWGFESTYSLLVSEGDIRWCDTVSLVVDKNLNLSFLHNTNT